MSDPNLLGEGAVWGERGRLDPPGLTKSPDAEEPVGGRRRSR